MNGNTDRKKKNGESQHIPLLVERILTGSLIILLIGFCSFAVLFVGMYFL